MSRRTKMKAETKKTAEFSTKEWANMARAALKELDSKIEQLLVYSEQSPELEREIRSLALRLEGLNETV